MLEPFFKSRGQQVDPLLLHEALEIFDEGVESFAYDVSERLQKLAKAVFRRGKSDWYRWNVASRLERESGDWD